MKFSTKWKEKPRNIWEYENRNALREFPQPDFLGVKVDIDKALYRHEPWKKLTPQLKRKWENMMIFAYAPMKIRYVYR